MRPARVITAIVFAAALTGCGARSTAGGSQPPETAPPPVTVPATPLPTGGPGGGRPVTGRCDAAALRGSVQGSEGAAGTIWTTVRLRNASDRTCSVRGIPEVRLLGVQGQPVSAPSEPDGPGGSPPQVAADRLVDAWVRGDRVAARKLAGGTVTDRLFGELAPARTPAAQPCRLAQPGVFVCSYPFADHAELTVVVEGGASAGYGVTGIEFGD
jgi:Protein of unknown function (DUF4232)